MADSVDDSQLLLTSLVPLQLTSTDGQVLWTNPAPSSPRLCRPLSVRFAKETPALLVVEKERVEEQASQLKPFDTELGTVVYTITMTINGRHEDGERHHKHRLPDLHHVRSTARYHE